MRLDDTEQAMRAGSMGTARRAAIEQQIRVGMTFDAEDFVEVSQVHLMADTESLGESGVAYLEAIAALPADERRVRVPNCSEAERSTAKSTVSSRSSEYFLTKGWPMRAETFQSIARYSSPAAYSRTSANSIPWPLNTEWYSPLNSVLTRPRVRSSISLT